MRILTSLLLFCLSTSLLAQSVYAPFGKDYYNLIDRYEIKNGEFAPGLHTSFKEYRRADITQLLDSLNQDSTNLTKVDKFNINYLYADNWQYNDENKEISKKPFLKHFYKTTPDLYSVNTEDFRLRANPVLHWQGGKEDNNDNILYINTRGIQVEGDIDNKISFYTFLAENQAVFPTYVDDYMKKFNAIPHEGFKKAVKDSTGQTIPGSADFFTARGYINFKATKHIDIQFGHGKQFVGNGYRSLILSDFSPDRLFLKFNTQIWKFRYTNLFSEMNAENSFGGDRVLDKKYLAFHHLGINLLKNLNVGVWESIPHGRNNGHLELQYLNPIIFYRSVEQQVGSGDNALLGMDMHWNFKKHFQFYSQITLDEFKLGELKARSGWWANKQAAQLGLKYVDVVGISNLDIQTEFNYIRPFTYTHKDNFRSYTHYGQPLAHDFGANIREFILLLRYQPTPKLTFNLRMINTGVGLDVNDTINYGNNILLDYNTRVKTYNNKVLQGEFVNIRKIDFTTTYMLKHNLFFDFKITMRDYNSEVDANDTRTTILGAAMRWNIGQRRHDF